MCLKEELVWAIDNSAETNVKDLNIGSLSIFSTNVLFYQTGNYSKNVINSIL